MTRKLFIWPELFRSLHLCFFPLRLLYLLLTYFTIHVSRQERKRRIFLRRPISAHIRLKHLWSWLQVVVVSCPPLRPKHCFGSRDELSSSPFAIFISISSMGSGQFLLPPSHLLIAHHQASVPAGTRILPISILIAHWSQIFKGPLCIKISVHRKEMVSPIRPPSAKMPEAQQCLRGCVNSAGLIGLSIYLPEGMANTYSQSLVALRGQSLYRHHPRSARIALKLALFRNDLNSIK